MKKIVLFVLSLLLLSGCASDKKTEDILSSSLGRPLPIGLNQNKGLFKYYIAPDMGIKSSNNISSVIKMGDSDIMLRLNVSNIITKYYDENKKYEFSEDERVTRYDGTYLDRDDVRQFYVLYEIDMNNQKAVVLENEAVALMGLISTVDYEYVLSSMMMVMRSVDVEEKSVVAEYSNKEVIEYNSFHEEFFEQKIPESGSLIDMYNQLHPDDKIEQEGGLRDDS